MNDPTPENPQDVSKNAEREERSEPYVDSYDVPLTDAERLAIGAEMAALDAEIGAHEAAKKAAVAEWNGKIETAYAALHEKAGVYRRGAAPKEVRVVDVRVLSLGQLRVVDADSGFVYFERALEALERQADLFVQDVAAKAAAAHADAKDTGGAEEKAAPSGGAPEGVESGLGATPDVFGGVHDPGETPAAPKKRSRKNKKNGAGGA